MFKWFRKRGWLDQGATARYIKENGLDTHRVEVMFREFYDNSHVCKILQCGLEDFKADMEAKVGEIDENEPGYGFSMAKWSVIYRLPKFFLNILATTQSPKKSLKKAGVNIRNEYL